MLSITSLWASRSASDDFWWPPPELPDPRWQNRSRATGTKDGITNLKADQTLLLFVYAKETKKVIPLLSLARRKEPLAELQYLWHIDDGFRVVLLIGKQH